MASKSLIWHTFGSLAAALKEAGFDVPVGEERLERAIADGAVLARELGHLPKMAEWKDARARDATLLSEWQVYRIVDVQPGRLVGVPVPRQRAAARGGRRGRPGRVARSAETVDAEAASRLAELRAISAARRSRQKRPSCGARTAGSASSSR